MCRGDLPGVNWCLTMKINNIFRLFLLQIKLVLTELKSVLFLLSLTVIIIAVFVVWWKETNLARPAVLIANEENGMLASLTINSILNNKVAEIVNFVTTGYDEGRKKIDNGEALLLVYIKKGTINTLYEGKKAEIDVYTKNENNDFTKLVISYIKGFTDIINVSQNAGLAYMDVLYKRGMTENERIQKFNELQSDYVKLTLARNSIFIGEDRVMGFSKKDIEAGYKTLVIIFLTGISIGMIIGNKLLNKALRQRLALSGISNTEIYFTVVSGVIFTDVIFLFVFKNIAKVIGIGD